MELNFLQRMSYLLASQGLCANSEVQIYGAISSDSCSRVSNVSVPSDLEQSGHSNLGHDNGFGKMRKLVAQNRSRGRHEDYPEKPIHVLTLMAMKNECRTKQLHEHFWWDWSHRSSFFIQSTLLSVRLPGTC